MSRDVKAEICRLCPYNYWYILEKYGNVNGVVEGEPVGIAICGFTCSWVFTI